MIREGRAMRRKTPRVLVAALSQVLYRIREKLLVLSRDSERRYKNARLMTTMSMFGVKHIIAQLRAEICPIAIRQFHGRSYESA